MLGKIVSCYFVAFPYLTLLPVMTCSFCGAVLFTKTLKNQRVAQVTFSDPLCISYGSGAESRSTIDQFSRNQDAAEIGDDDQRINCPILEFRLVNKVCYVFNLILMKSYL